MSIERIKQQALAYLLKNGNHPPAVHVFGTKGSTITLLAGIPEDGPDKSKALFIKGAETAKSAAIGPLTEVFLVSEAWVSVKQSMHGLDRPPSTDPGRKEALVVYGIDTLTKEQRMFVFELVRDASGIVRTIQPLSGTGELQPVSNPFLMSFLAGYASRGLVKHR